MPIVTGSAGFNGAGGIHIQGKEFFFFRTLRNQAVMAIKQGG